MEIYISNAGQTPIYAQITAQIREKILTGELQAGDALPSVITTKRAYEDLEQEGFIHTLPGKGSFVAAQNRELLREQTLKQIEELLERAVDAARMGGVTPGEVREMLELLHEE